MEWRLAERRVARGATTISNASDSGQGCQAHDAPLKGHVVGCRHGFEAGDAREESRARFLGAALFRVSLMKGELESAAAVAAPAAASAAPKARTAPAAPGPVLLRFGLIHGQGPAV